jgi:anti-anti-sigma regulatory factor
LPRCVGGEFVLPRSLDVDATGSLTDRLMHHVATTRGAVVIDCSELEQIDPSAVGVLVTLVRWVRSQGRDCQLDLISPAAQQEIAALGYDSVLGVDRVCWRATEV